MGLRFLSFCALCIVLVFFSFDHYTVNAKKVDHHHHNAKQKKVSDDHATNVRKVVDDDHHHHNAKQNKQIQGKNCNIFHGSWVWDNSTRPYDPMTCPFIRKEFACKKYGRLDDLYLKYRWQPMSCNLPRFDGQDFLRRFKGKKIMFIGDSLSRNAWISLSCLLHAAVPTAKFTIETRGAMTTVTFQDYGVSVNYFLSLHLVDIEKERTSRIMKIDSIKDGDIWKNMDILIFNTFQWWGRRGPKQQWDYIQEGGKIYSDMDRMVAFRKGLTTWANWVNSDVNTRKTRVFFQGISPSHYNGNDWNKPGEKNCAKETQPLKGSVYPGGVHPATKIVKEVLSTIRKPVYLLDLTTLSQLRPDAHPSGYNGFRGMDCTHWCVPGLPDTWNQLLYTSLISQQ